MLWLYIAISAHFLSALVFTADKFIISKRDLHPVAYGFYVGLLGGVLVLALAPFGFSVPLMSQILLSFTAGVLFILATVFFYSSIMIGDVSRVAPFIGGAVPVFTALLSYFFLGETFSFSKIAAFCFLVFGGVVIAWSPKNVKIKETRFSSKKGIAIALLAAFCFAASFVITKFVFEQLSFVNGFIWIRMGGLFVVLAFLLWPKTRKIIGQESLEIKPSTGILALSSKGLSAGSFVLLNYAIYLGSVSLVNALQGVQYLFLFAIGLALSKKAPELVKEQISRSVVIKKILGILSISIGLAVLIL